ncbi:MAG: hypothetical protein AA908_03875 [Chlorobi bacterium NICIL-2]|nr:MAG: hypothetical protein AA908_03875 [Chlorobi bacterium NICIL-2]
MMHRRILAFLLCTTSIATSQADIPQHDQRWIASQCTLITGQRWTERPFPVLYAMVAQLFVGRPYRAGTLDTGLYERCRFTSEGFDCVTFVESALALAQSAALGQCSYDQFMRQLERIRYRHGILDGYLSRLHYTSEWIADNVAKGIVRDISSQLGAKSVRKKLDFMSTHPELYPQLRDSSALIAQIRTIERRLSRRPMAIIPLDRLPTALGGMQSGDIIAIATTKPGLDYAHLGIALRSGGKLSLLHASSKSGKVTLEPSLEEYVRSYPSAAGISVVRPLAPVKSTPR